MSYTSPFFSSPLLIFATGFLLRVILIFYGIHQDSVSALKYTDIDYYVFTDAARAVARNRSPYDRATYRYTPLLAWILLPTTWGGLWFHFGKAIFAISDLVAGWLILVVLRRKGLDNTSALKYASVWVLNPMVANISTRGSSEGLLCVMVMALLWSFESGRITLSGLLLGLSVHFKIYPFIYGASMIWALDTKSRTGSHTNWAQKLLNFFNQSRLNLLITSLATFTSLNVLMYVIYGPPFLQHTFWHHITRIDHRHNFSPYNTLLYLSSAKFTNHVVSFESLAFVPQLLLSAILLPVALSRYDLPSTMLAQTLAFVTFNKVCTSQYFLWYLIFLPLYLPNSVFLLQPRLGLTALGLWVAGQAAWLQQAYQLEFLGRSTFVPGLWMASLLFFGVNCWILGVIIEDVLSKQPNSTTKAKFVQDENGTITSKLSSRAPFSSEKNTEAFPDFPTSTTNGIANDRPASSSSITTNASATTARPSSSSLSVNVREDRKSSISGTNIGTTHLGPRNRVLRSS